MKRALVLVLIVTFAASHSAFAADAATTPAVPTDVPAVDGFTMTVARHYDHDALEIVYPTKPKGQTDLVHMSPEGRFDLIKLTGGDAKKLTYAFWVDVVTKAGWQVLSRDDSSTVVAHRTDGGKDRWMTVNLQTIRYLEVAAPIEITLAAPGKTVEDLKEGADAPYLAPITGSKLTSWHHSNSQMKVNAAKQPEQFVGPPEIAIDYRLPGTSGIMVHEVYEAALKKADWTIVNSSPGGPITAHYAKNGRDIWVLVGGGDDNYRVRIVDVGANAAAAKLAKELAEQGHVAVYGIYFDTDKSVLRGDSEATLQQILALLTKDPKLKLEIQGHTDDQGNRAANQKLSEDRAASVKKWLVDHKIDGGRLTTAGFADTKPVADNKKPEGRAKNRRVELVKT
jgi:outer membrane protein OmpA-like peptidoglycan-associated protein